MIFLLVVKKELTENRKNLLIYALTVFLVLLLQEVINAFIAVQSGITHVGYTNYAGSFSLFLFVGGFIITSMAFAQDMFTREGQHNWLMLPASRFEKFLAKGGLSACAYPIALTILFALSSVIIELLTLALFGTPMRLFNPISQHVIHLIGHYLAVQSIFLLGSTFFRKGHFMKTVLAIGVIALAIGAFSTLLVRVIFAPYISDLFGAHIVLDSSTIQQHQGFFGVSRWILSILYRLILPLFCWVTSYIRVKEVQATDAIQ